MAPDEASITAVTAELAELGERLIDRAFERVLKRGPLELPYLFELAAQHFCHQWQHDKPSALELLLSTAIRRLPADELFERSKMPLRQAAYMAFNIAAPEYNVDKVPIDLLQGKKNSALYKRLMDAANVHITPSPFRNTLTALRKRLARILLDPGFPFFPEEAGLPGPAGAPSADSKTDSLIARPKDLAWLHESYSQLSATGGIFMLWGLAGMGKTTLVRQFAREIGPEQAIGFIRIGRRGLYEEDIRRVLRLEGHDQNLWTDAQCHAMLRTTANQLRVIRLLVLDDVRTDDDINALLPRGCNVPVVITGRERLTLADLAAQKAARFRQIAPLPMLETAAYLLRQHPGLKRRTAARLADVSGGHAETVAHITHYLVTSDIISPEELLDELIQRTGQILADMNELGNVRDCLSVILRRLCRELAEYELSRAILACAIWTNECGEQAREVVVETLAEWRGGRPRTLEMEAALARLERLGLIACTSDSLSMPRLTCLVLRDLLVDLYDSVLCAYERVIAIPPREGSEGNRRIGLLETLRTEYSYALPMQGQLAEFLGSKQQQLPSLVMLDQYNWALFVSMTSGTRLVNLYRVTPGGVLLLRPQTRAWEDVLDNHLDGLDWATEQYFDLLRSAYEKRYSPQEWARSNAEANIETDFYYGPGGDTAG